jgi:hypothetical protein
VYKSLLGAEKPGFLTPLWQNLVVVLGSENQVLQVSLHFGNGVRIVLELHAAHADR